MQLTEEHKKIIAEQKKQCPFCKIVKGEIPSKILFKDEKILVLLDINPITKGHVLLMPKDHYPIMPFISEQTREHLFRAAVNLSQILKMTFLQAGTTIFIANGAAAGQQSTHFLMHLFPRDETLHPALNLKEKALDNYEEHFALFKQLLPQRLQELAQKFPLEEIAHDEDPSSSQTEEDLHASFVREVLRIIRANPELKQLILNDPELVKKSIPHHPQLAKMFKRVSFDEIYELLREEEENGKKPKEEDRKKDEEVTEQKAKSFSLSYEKSQHALQENQKKKPDLDKISRLFK